MDSSTARQELGLETIESMLACTKTQQEKKPRPADMEAQKCPRCDSSNTKFCYYNNYSLSQPRYFCKSCRRYWTKGGTLRNVPVGGGCRKNKRSSSSSSSSSSSKRSQDHHITPIPAMTPLSYDSNDLSLAISSLQKQNSGDLGLEDHVLSIWGHPNIPQHHLEDVLGNYVGNPSSSGLVDAIRTGFLENPSGGNRIQNVYYAMGNGNVEAENGGMGIPYEEYGGVATTASTVKQEMRGGGNGWDLDSGRLNWNGISSSFNWQGLLNSPLM